MGGWESALPPFAAAAAALSVALATGIELRSSVVSGFRALAGMGSFLERAHLSGRAGRAASAEARRAACLNDLPALLDVVTLGLSAGLSFDASLELYCSRNEGILARAFEEAMLSWRIGASTRERALWRVADDMGVPALGRFASVVGEALAFGAPLAEALEGQARVIRDERRAQVEERIERVPVKMLIPLGTLVVPAMFLAVLGPLLGSVMG